MLCAAEKWADARAAFLASAEGFQRAEYLKTHGMVDMVVHRKDMRATLSSLCAVLMKRPAREGGKAA